MLYPASTQKNNLDGLVINNKWLEIDISNHSFLSKIFENNVYKQLNEYISTHTLCEKCQSANQILDQTVAQKQLLIAPTFVRSYFSSA